MIGFEIEKNPWWKLMSFRRGTVLREETDRIQYFFKPITTGLENFSFRSRSDLKIEKYGAGNVVGSDVNE